MRISGVSPRPFLNVNRLTLQAFEGFHLEDTHTTRERRPSARHHRGAIVLH